MIVLKLFRVIIGYHILSMSFIKGDPKKMFLFLLLGNQVSTSSLSLNSLVVSVPASGWDGPGSSPGEVTKKFNF